LYGIERRKRGTGGEYSIKNVGQEPLEKRPDVGKWWMEGMYGY
jgi:hypothetical protein